MQQSEDALVVLTTVPDRVTGEKLAKQLVEHQLAACVNLLAPMQSYYLWQGTVECDDEQQLLIKTRASLLQPVENFIRDHHPYDVPELIALPTHAMGADYLKWLKQSVK